ncbi:hypothetical protein CCMA1212_003559 [Trichoderma ghanense]|uniref:Uncharacterized protein n=1 Tax=Trichoderma ghanense TaxID=65468 RepID=A0ABY2H8A8_9HYPO
MELHAGVRGMYGIRPSVRPLETMTPLAPSAEGVEERRRVQGVGTSPPAIHTLTLVQCKTAQSLHGEFLLYMLLPCKCFEPQSSSEASHSPDEAIELLSHGTASTSAWTQPLKPIQPLSQMVRGKSVWMARGAGRRVGSRITTFCAMVTNPWQCRRETWRISQQTCQWHYGTVLTRKGCARDAASWRRLLVGGVWRIDGSRLDWLLDESYSAWPRRTAHSSRAGRGPFSHFALICLVSTFVYRLHGINGTGDAPAKGQPGTRHRIPHHWAGSCLTENRVALRESWAKARMASPKRSRPPDNAGAGL